MHKGIKIELFVMNVGFSFRGFKAEANKSRE